jgi:DNA-binding transcriptional regulator PaaX
MHLVVMHPKTEEFLYHLLFTCDVLFHPTARNLSHSFESWAYQKGLNRRLIHLERRQLLEQRPAESERGSAVARVVRLTQAGKLHVLGGRDPEQRWSRPWDGLWRLVAFDFPERQNHVRDRLRLHLRSQGFGYLQNSVWITPDPLEEEKSALAGMEVDVESLILLEARPCAGESDQDIVVGAWNFERINSLYQEELRILESRPPGPLTDEPAARAFQRWAAKERAAWQVAVNSDPLLPERLLPKSYLGRNVWRTRLRTIAQGAIQMRSFAAAR